MHHLIARCLIALALCAAPVLSADAHPNLSGTWMGVYRYDQPTDLPVGNTVMILAAHDEAAFTGRHYEANTFGPQRRDATLECDIIGSFDAARTLTFMHRYDGRGGVTHVLKYTGTVSADGTEIRGTWSITDAWTGTFIFRKIDFETIK